MKLTVLGLASLFLLTGCSSSPSIEEQTKLLEYEKCLDYYINLNNRVENSNTSVSPFPIGSGTSYGYTTKKLSEIYRVCEPLLPSARDN